MRILVARHGQTQWNALNKVCGRTDLPLTELGHAQARNWPGSWNMRELI